MLIWPGIAWTDGKWDALNFVRDHFESHELAVQGRNLPIETVRRVIPRRRLNARAQHPKGHANLKCMLCKFLYRVLDPENSFQALGGPSQSQI